MPLDLDREYWLGRAEEMRAKVSTLSKDSEAPNLLGIAETYMRIADKITAQADVLAEMSKHIAE